MYFVYIFCVCRKYFTLNIFFYSLLNTFLEFWTKRKEKSIGDDITLSYSLKSESNDKLELENKF